MRKNQSAYIITPYNIPVTTYRFILNQNDLTAYSEIKMTEMMTPAMRQYYEAKQAYPDTLVFFRMGDFYESFGEDAKTISKELEITLTARGKDKTGHRMPLPQATRASANPSSAGCHNVNHPLGIRAAAVRGGHFANRFH